MAEAFKNDNRKAILIHLGILFSIFTLLILCFFYIYLPFTTNHNQTVTVPSIVGMDSRELSEYLAERELDLQIDDSTYRTDPGARPFAVFSQFPPAGQKVKKGRKIFVSINACNPPKVKMPALVNRSLINAQSELESYGLFVGSIQYVPDMQVNAVLKQIYAGKEIAEGQLIAKGSKVDLIVGDGLGNQEFDVPDLVGKSQEEVEILLNGISLQVGSLIYDSNSDMPSGTVIKQKPLPGGNKIRVGEVIDLWISGTDPKSNANTDSGD